MRLRRSAHQPGSVQRIRGSADPVSPASRPFPAGYRAAGRGKTLGRPELDQLRAAVRAGEIRRLYVYRLDRLTRSGIRDTLDLVEELRRSGVDLVTVADGFDLNGPAAEIILAVMAWAAKMERLAINERICAARARLEAEGRHWGRPKRLTASELAAIRADHEAGRTVREISQARKVPRSTLPHGRFLREAV